MFNYYQPSRIHFGIGKLKELGEVAAKYGKKCLLVTTPNEAPLDKLYTRVKEILSNENIEVIHFDKVLSNPTIEIVNEGFKIAKREDFDFVLAVGGGSSIDTGKIIALTNGLESIDWERLFSDYTSPFIKYDSLSEKGLPLIAVSTTSGTGSQVTQASVISIGKNKNTIFHPDNFSKECIVDPELMKTLPPRITASTGFDAFTHAFESYINKNASVITEIQSLKAMELVINNLQGAFDQGENIKYRENLAIADTLAGSSLANVGAAAPHPLSEIIGGIINIPHGEALAVIFPAFVKKYYISYINKFATVARLFNNDLNNEEDEKAAGELYNELNKFLSKLGLKKRLRDFNVSKEQLQEVLESPILGFLPFGTKEELQEIIKQSY
ncbi:iron-containing alcohol dehydrogenase [Clostridium niameyense]|uniref:Iron-containing alcohol dehydrogenase n=1 Tax=Clostridium niameyense TaxID=1622073 RepID=A0A6M0RB30_9CLOT|nr:iron-containing alcohol dehydrogenase [Clostridium niameyense]NEZ46759.1 iron-containing alcohol dehydrogenase [Clostridium niameyense]